MSGSMFSKKSERLGSIGKNKYGSAMVIDEYNHVRDLWVKFLENGNRVHTTWLRFTQGSVKNVYDLSIFGVGYIGEGKYKTQINKKITPQFLSWKSMMARCYCENTHQRQPSYKDATVSEEWHNFQTFAKWYDENYYSIEGEEMHLDKDILIKGNKVYSPDTCIFVPRRINTIFTNAYRRRGKYPIGVGYYPNSQKMSPYRAMCNNGTGRQVSIGSFKTPEEAFASYKKFKEDQIRTLADQYKDYIPIKLYDVMYKYEVKIDD